MTARPEWAALDTAGRSELLRARSRAYFVGGHARVEQRPAGTVIELDVRDVTDHEGFFCALGDAIQGLITGHEQGVRGEGTLWKELRELLAHRGVSVEDVSRASCSP